MTWNGQTLGHTDTGKATRGTATLSLTLDTLSGTATFANLRHPHHGDASWGADIATNITARGNYLEGTSAGPWKGFNGWLRGANHEGVTGAFHYEAANVEPLTAAFGATR